MGTEGQVLRRRRRGTAHGKPGGWVGAAAREAERGGEFVVLSKPGCPWCDRAADLLAGERLRYRVVECADGDDMRRRLRGMGLGEAADGATTFPQVVDPAGRHVGGYDALERALAEATAADEDAGDADETGDADTDEADETEPLLSAETGTRRFTPFPLRYPDMWDMYLRALASFWTADEVSLAQDVVDWREKLTDDERHFVKHVLAFFAGADGIVMENIQLNFGAEVQVAEARQFLAYQAFNEAEHSRQYALLIDALIEDSRERDRLFRAIETMPAVRAKAAWAMKWLDPTRPFAQRVLAFTCVEGILFSGSFCAIFWLKQRGLMPGLGLSNQFISRDEGLHQQFGALMYSKLRRRLDQATAETIVREAVDNEKAFIVEAIPCRLVGMNADLMARYIEFVADRLLLSMGYRAAYGASNPFPWMELLSLSGKDNFFERFSSEYQKAGVMARPEDQTFALDGDF